MPTEITNLLVGAFAGIVPLVFSLPVDYIKVSIQLSAEGQRHYHSHPITILKEVYKQKGVREFYRGLPAAVQRQFFLGSLRLGGTRILTQKLSSPSNPLTLPYEILLAFITGGLAAWVASPYDLVLIRLQSERLLPQSQKRLYTGTFNTIYRVIKEEGFTSLWKGASTVVFKSAIINSASLTGYEKIKKKLDEYYGFAPSHRIYASITSTAFACALSLPVDNIKTKIQKMVRLSDGTFPYKNLFDCFVKSIQREGFLGLYVGFPVYVLRLGPHVVASMLIQDYLHYYIRNK